MFPICIASKDCHAQDLISCSFKHFRLNAARLSKSRVDAMQAEMEVKENILCWRTGQSSMEVLIPSSDSICSVSLQTIAQDFRKFGEIKIELVEHKKGDGEWDESLSDFITLIVLHGLSKKGWVNTGFPNELEGKVSATTKLLVKMNQIPANRRTYDSALVDVVVKCNDIIVAFEPASLCLCPFEIPPLLAADPFHRAKKIWDSGGVVDLTEIAENSESAFTFRCASLCGLRKGILLAISKSPISKWLSSRIDPEEFDGVNPSNTTAECDAIFRQLVRAGLCRRENQELCVFRDEANSAFFVKPLVCVVKTYLLQRAQRALGNARQEESISRFVDDLISSSSQIQFEKKLKTVNVEPKFQDESCMYNFVDRVACNPSTKPTKLLKMPSKPPAKFPDVDEYSTYDMESLTANAIVESGLLQESFNFQFDDDIDNAAKTKQDGDLILPSAEKKITKLQGPAQNDESTTHRQANDKLSSLNAFMEAVPKSKNPSATLGKEPTANAQTNSMTTQAIFQSKSSDKKKAVCESNAGTSKKRKDPPSQAGEDLSLAYWEAATRDGSIHKMTVPAIKLFLSTVKQPVSGKKELLIERLKIFFKISSK